MDISPSVDLVTATVLRLTGSIDGKLTVGPTAEKPSRSIVPQRSFQDFYSPNALPILLSATSMFTRLPMQVPNSITPIDKYTISVFQPHRRHLPASKTLDGIVRGHASSGRDYILRRRLYASDAKQGAWI